MEKKLASQNQIPMIDPTNLQSLNKVFSILKKLNKKSKDDKIRNSLINTLLNFTHHSSVGGMPLSLDLKTNIQNELFYALTDEIYGKGSTIIGKSPINYGMKNEGLRLFSKFEDGNHYLLDVIFDRKCGEFTDNQLNLYKYKGTAPRNGDGKLIEFNCYSILTNIWARNDGDITFITHGFKNIENEEWQHDNDVNYGNTKRKTPFTPRQDSIESVEIINKILQQIKY